MDDRYDFLVEHTLALVQEYRERRARESAGHYPYGRTVARGDLWARATEIKNNFEDLAEIFRHEAKQFRADEHGKPAT